MSGPATRREFLTASVRAGIALPMSRVLPDWPAPPSNPGLLRPLHERFPDLRRHFVFEYYPWYAADPYRHWEQWSRRPPADIAANYVPLLGAYDSRSPAVLERHARWIADSGAGAVNVSWWGRGSFEDRALPLFMDAMRDHDLQVTFHLEPYADDHGLRFADDVLYLLREYGERRGFDALLLLRDEDGAEGPAFKGFRTILPETATDCHGVTRPVSDFTPDDEWRRVLDSLRSTLRYDFDRLVLLSDTVNLPRAREAGFDGIAVYDNFVPPTHYPGYATAASDAGLLFSFNANAGFDGISPRRLEPGSCYVAPPFAPEAGALDWSSPAERERAASLCVERIRASFDSSLAVQSDPALTNTRRGFFLVYLNSFNEWHEGTSFEPMRDAEGLEPEQRALGYHNPARGGYRLAALTERLRAVLEPPVPNLQRRAAISGPRHPGAEVAP